MIDRPEERKSVCICPKRREESCRCAAFSVSAIILFDLPIRTKILTEFDKDYYTYYRHLAKKLKIEPFISSARDRVGKGNRTRPIDTMPKQTTVVDTSKMAVDELLAIMEKMLVEVTAKVIMDHITSLKKSFEYKGFDPINFRKVLASHYLKNNETLPVHISMCFDEKLALPIRSNFSGGIDIMIILYNLRGNNVSHILDSMDALIKAEVYPITTAFQVQSKVKDKGSASPETVTLSRIAMTFPNRAVNLAARGVFRSIVPLVRFGIKEDDLFGRAISHPMAVSVLSKEMLEQGYMYVTFWVCFSINKIIGDKESRNDHEKFWLYHQAAAKSRVCPSEAREQVWEPLDKTDYVEELLKAAKRFVKKLGDKVYEEVKAFGDEVALGLE